MRTKIGQCPHFVGRTGNYGADDRDDDDDGGDGAGTGDAAAAAAAGDDDDQYTLWVQRSICASIRVNMKFHSFVLSWVSSLHGE